MSPNLQMPRNGASTRFVLLVSLCSTPLAYGEENFAVTVKGTKLAVDLRTFSPDGDAALDDHAGCLSNGGYCHVGASLEKRYFRVDADPPKGPVVEVVHHPRDYAFGAHDLVGTVRASAGLDHVSTGRQSGKAAEIPIELLEWSAPGAVVAQVICCAPTEPDGRSGMVAWYSHDASSNGIVTVCMRYKGLEGIPRAVADRYLMEYPSAVEPEFVARDWVDDDLDKWIQIVRSQPEDRLIRSIAARFLREYEREAKQDWGVRQLVSYAAGSDELKSIFVKVTDNLEQWRRSRKELE